MDMFGDGYDEDGTGEDDVTRKSFRICERWPSSGHEKGQGSQETKIIFRVDQVLEVTYTVS